MKKLLSILLAALMLCSGLAMTFGVTASAAPAQKIEASAANPFDSIFNAIAKTISGFDLENLSKTQETIIVTALEFLKKTASSDTVGTALKEIDKAYGLPITFKNLLHKNGIYSFPFYERSVFWNFIFKWLLLGFIWMPLVK